MPEPSRFFDESASERAARLAETGLPHDEPSHRLLIVGTGMMGREHLRVAQLLGRARVRGIFDTHAASLDLAEADFAQRSGQRLRRYSSLQAAASDLDIDAILVCTPNYSHWQVVQALAATGKPLLIEKPMATTIADAVALWRLAEDYPTFMQLGMQYRYKSQYIEAFRAVRREGALGKLHSIAMSEYRPPFLDKVGQWNKFNRYSGGTLVEKCCHYFDLINLLAESRPTRVFASGGQAVNFLDFQQDGQRADIDDHAFVVMDFANGRRASFTLNMFSGDLYEELVLCGERGRLVASERSSFRPGTRSSAQIRVEREGHPAASGLDVTYPPAIEASGHHGATLFEHEAFVDRLEGRENDAATPLQGLWALLLASAAQASMASGEAVNMSDFLAAQGLDELPTAFE